MAIYDLFSKRQKRLRGEVPDVYVYDEIPQGLRTQFVLLTEEEVIPFQSFEVLVNALCREYGQFFLHEKHNNPYGNRDFKLEMIHFVMSENDTERVLDAVELFFQLTEDFYGVDALIDELNHRFKEHGVGYEFNSSQLIRIDSEFIHAEAVKPALSLLSDPAYAGAQQEFLSAFDHYRHDKYKEAVVDALKAFESTLKVICAKQSWKIKETDTASKLLDVCYKQMLIPTFWQNHMTGLRATLEGGVPTGRNKTSGHGQGAVPTDVPDHLVSYVLHMTAATIVFLVKSEQALT